MTFTDAVDHHALDAFKDNGAVELTDADVKASHEKLKAKLRAGCTIHAVGQRQKLYIRLLMNGKPLRDGQYVPNLPQSGDDAYHRESWLTDSGYIARHSVLKQLYADLPEITNAPLLPSLAAVLLVYFEKNHVYYLLYNWLQSAPTGQLPQAIATSEHQITSDDMTMRDLALLRIKAVPLKNYLTQTTTTIQWRQWLREVNLQTLINTFDAMFCEGPKIKFRFGLAYLALLVKNGAQLDETMALDQHQQQKILAKAFQIKRFSWSTCSKLINRHKLLIDIRAGAKEVDTADFSVMAEQANAKVVAVEQLARIIAILPPRFTVQKVERIFCTLDDGYALSTARKRLDGISDAILVIETEHGHIGCFMAGIDAKSSAASTGTGESFVFAIEEGTGAIGGHFWHEQRGSSLFANFTKTSFNFGNGAIMVDSDLKLCSSSASATFDSPNLFNAMVDFEQHKVVNVELLSFFDASD